MKPFWKQTYYEVLEVSPHALPIEIRHAYKKALSLYEDSAIASYSFFSKAERQEIIDCIQKAYLTLINAETRSTYDRQLQERGIPAAPDPGREGDRRPVALYEFQRASAYDRSPNRHRSLLKSLATENRFVQELLDRTQLTGDDLERIRMALQVPLEEISRETNIRLDILRAIETGTRDRLPPRVYLKGFLKAYARCLALDEQRLATAYLQWVEQKGDPAS